MCRWHGEFRNCSEMFTSSKTDDGFCCSFNTVNLAEGFAKLEEEEEDDDGNGIGDYDYPAGDYYDDYDYPDLNIAPVGQLSFDSW